MTTKLTAQDLSDEALATICSPHSAQDGKRWYIMFSSNDQGWEFNTYFTADNLHDAKLIASEYTLRIRGGSWKVTNVIYNGLNN